VTAVTLLPPFPLPSISPLKPLAGDVVIFLKLLLTAFSMKAALNDAVVADVDTISVTTDANTTTSNYKISKNNTTTFKVKGTYMITGNGNWDIRMAGIKWNTNDTTNYTTSDYMSKAGGDDGNYDSSWISDVEYLQP